MICPCIQEMFQSPTVEGYVKAGLARHHILICSSMTSFSHLTVQLKVLPTTVAILVRKLMIGIAVLGALQWTQESHAIIVINRYAEVCIAWMVEGGTVDLQLLEH